MNEVGGTFEMPIGMAMSMAQSPAAMKAFASLSESEQAAVITKAKAVRSRDEMVRLVNGLANNN